MPVLQSFIVKSVAQNLICALPRPIGDSLYYFAQRRFGSLRHADPFPQIHRAVELMQLASSVRSIAGARVLEIGTGRNVTLPIVLWLCGADEVHTLDLHRYLRRELIEEDVAEMFRRELEIMSLLERAADAGALQRRWQRLRAAGASAQAVMDLCRITYHAPADARSTPFPSARFDFHVSNNVLEHVPPDDIRRILSDGFRTLAAPGALIHRVDLSDHFAQRDPRLSLVNFLRYSELQWGLLSGNRLMYQNRLRIDDWEMLLSQELVGADIRLIHDGPERGAMAALNDGLPVSTRFAQKPPEINAVLSVLVLAAKRSMTSRHEL